MRFSPLAIILIVLALLFVFGGHSYNSGAYVGWGYGGGSILFIIVLLLIFGVL